MSTKCNALYPLDRDLSSVDSTIHPLTKWLHVTILWVENFDENLSLQIQQIYATETRSSKITKTGWVTVTYFGRSKYMAVCHTDLVLQSVMALHYSTNMSCSLFSLFLSARVHYYTVKVRAETHIIFNKNKNFPLNNLVKYHCLC